MDKKFYFKREMLGIVIWFVVILVLLWIANFLNLIDGYGEIITVFGILGTIASVITLFITFNMAKKKRWF